MKFRYSPPRASDAKLLVQVGDWDVWHEPERKRICCTKRSSGCYWAPVNSTSYSGQPLSFEDFLRRYHIDKPGVRKALRAGRDVLMDPSVSPNAKAS